MIQEKTTAVAVTIFFYQLLNILSIGLDLRLIAIIAIDEHHKVSCPKGYLRAFIVRCGRAHPTLVVAIDRKSGNVYQASSYALEIGRASCRERV